MVFRQVALTGGDQVNEQRYVAFDYVDGWVGVRMEPKDQVRAAALVAAIPSQDRKYIRPKRLWAIRPKHLSRALEVIQHYCPDFPIILEEQHHELLAVAIQVATAGQVIIDPTPEVPRPTGVSVGTLRDLLGNW